MCCGYKKMECWAIVLDTQVGLWDIVIPCLVLRAQASYGKATKYPPNSLFPKGLTLRNFAKCLKHCCILMLEEFYNVCSDNNEVVWLVTICRASPSLPSLSCRSSTRGGRGSSTGHCKNAINYWRSQGVPTWNF